MLVTGTATTQDLLTHRFLWQLVISKKQPSMTYLDIWGLMTERRDLTSPGDKQNKIIYKTDPNIQIRDFNKIIYIFKKSLKTY